MANLFLPFLLLLLMASSHALVAVKPRRTAVVASLRMSAEINDNDIVDNSTEQHLLLEAKKRRELGLKQDIGVTVRKDGLDGLRALVWGIFDISQVVFGCLGVALTLGLLLNMMGYGYHVDWSSSQGGVVVVVIDTLDHMRQDKFMAEEAARLAAEAAQNVQLQSIPF